MALDFFYFNLEGPELEFMCAGKVKEKESKQPVLVLVDKENGMTRAIPLPSKDDVAVLYCMEPRKYCLSSPTLEELKFPFVQTANSVYMLNLVDRVVNARMKVGLFTRKSPSQLYARETNDAAEQAIQFARNVGASFLQHLHPIGLVKNTSDVVC